ncbi:MAG: histone acetyltransferase 1 [Claussenomyces sp. TS43310]|nr:MAG: histone acetyltransferase 1 [Claussenomyces sp. TS43310]
MADINADWSANANDAITVSLVTPVDGTSKTIASFNPKFTYSIFGDDESIFGYQGLKIHLKYHACDMRPGIQITYNKKFKAVGDTEPTDVRAILEEYLPNTAFDKTSVFEASINVESYKEWKPPGELLRTIIDGGETFEIWKGSLADRAVQQLLKRMQILVPFFIEGGTLIELKDPEWSLQRWTVFLLYKRNNTLSSTGSPYVFVGYSTVYRYYLYKLPTPPSSPTSKTDAISSTKSDFSLPFPDASISTFPCRSRISQFIILPAFQGGGHGSRLYETIFKHYLEAPETTEITVEDPNEAFDDLRDLNDLSLLRGTPEFTSLRINTDTSLRPKGVVPTAQIVDQLAVESLRQKMKIAPRQFARLVEMQLLSLIPTWIRQSLLLEEKRGTSAELKLKEHEYHLWQLFVKQRLYRHNKQSLIQLDRSERIDKLDEALSSVEADYARLLRSLDPKTQGMETNGKRSAEDVEDAGEPSSKKARIDE